MDIPTLDDLKRVEDKIDNLMALVTNVVNNANGRKVVTVSDICEMEGVSKTQILGKELYLLPNFGQSEYPVGTTRWNIETYLNWRGIPVAQRHQMMVKHLDHVRTAGMKNIKKGAKTEL